VDECRYILLHCNILFSQLSFTANMKKKTMVRNLSVRFGRHINIEISYKILQLEVPKLIPILYYPACFEKGVFGGNIEQKHPLFFMG
jgi:hypothetical protein